MNSTQTVNTPFEVRKLLLQFVNAEEAQYDVISMSYTLKNRGHQIATYNRPYLLYIYTALDEVEDKTKHQTALMKQIKNKVLER